MKLVYQIIIFLFPLTIHLVAQENNYIDTHFDSNSQENPFNSYTKYTQKDGLLSNQITTILNFIYRIIKIFWLEKR